MPDDVKKSTFQLEYITATLLGELGSETCHLHLSNAMTSNFRLLISTRKVRKVLLQLNTSKSSGPDGIPAIVLLSCAPELTPVLNKLFQLSYSLGIFHSSWKLAHIFPIPQKGDKSDPSNYRPIAITSLISKTMETIITRQLLAFLETNSLLSDH